MLGFERADILNSERYIHQAILWDFFSELSHNVSFSKRLRGNRGTKNTPIPKKPAPTKQLNGLRSPSPALQQHRVFLDWSLFSLIIRRLLKQVATSDGFPATGRIDFCENRNSISLMWMIYIEVKKHITHIYHIYISYNSYIIYTLRFP